MQTNANSLGKEQLRKLREKDDEEEPETELRKRIDRFKIRIGRDEHVACHVQIFLEKKRTEGRRSSFCYQSKKSN